MWPRILAASAFSLLAAGCSGGVDRSSLTVGVETAPKPPRGALVLAAESGGRAVALAVQPRRLTATVLGSSGEPLSGLKLTFKGVGGTVQGRPCGKGCYTTAARLGPSIEVRPGGSRPVEFDVPTPFRPAAAIVARAARATRTLESLVYVESLRSGPTGGLLTTWSLRAPDRVEYRIRGGAQAIVIGQRRWDRDKAGQPWRRSQQLPPLRVPQPAWGALATNAYVLGEARINGRPVWIVSFVNPQTPAWFTAWIDQQTYRPLRLKMTAAAHFMEHRYLAFDRPLAIRPPR